MRSYIAFGEVAKALAISRPTARKKLQDGEIPGLVKLVFGEYRVNREIFEKWLGVENEKVKPKLSRVPDFQLVYFLESTNPPNPVKIGFSTRHNLEMRISQLQIASAHKLKLLGVTAGTRANEQALHKKFRSDRLQGEWFSASERLHKFLKSLEDSGKLLKL